MPDIDSFYPAKTLKKEDLNGEEWLLTIREVDRTEFKDSKSGAVDIKPILLFMEIDQSMVLNPTNKEIIKSMFGKMTENWIGKQITIYNDPTVMYEGRKGGLRVRFEQALPKAPVRPGGQRAPQPTRPAPGVGGKTAPPVTQAEADQGDAYEDLPY